ncbi:MAG TPA: glycosyltransferase [Stenomitos sp.]
MKILFVDQSGDPGGAELSLMDLACTYREDCLVALFYDGLFRQLLEDQGISCQVLETQSLTVRKEGGLLQVLGNGWKFLPLVQKIAQLSREYDVVYANTPKALVVTAIAHLIEPRPLIYHLRDFLSKAHFSWFNRQLLVQLANRCATTVIANSKATQQAFIESGGNSQLTRVVYNGFVPERYERTTADATQTRQTLGLEGKFVVGHFSRISPWKGQHVLIEALSYCTTDVVAILVGGDFFGADAYVEELKQTVQALHLEDRVRFLGFHSDVASLMAACDVITHTSTAPEPFGRVIIEAMLCGRPIIGAAAGGAIELIDHQKTGWLCSPEDAHALATLIMDCRNQPQKTDEIALAAKQYATQQFHLSHTAHQVQQLIDEALKTKT